MMIITVLLKQFGNATGNSSKNNFSMSICFAENLEFFTDVSCFFLQTDIVYQTFPELLFHSTQQSLFLETIY